MVVADTTPLNYLILIGADDILPRLYGEILIPTAVGRELRSARAPHLVAQWISNPPLWLSIVSPAAESDNFLEGLGAGEREAILLAESGEPPMRLLIDEAAGRREAARRGLEIIGTLGILDAAAEREFLDLPRALDALRATTFYVAPSLLKVLLDRDSKRRKLAKRE